MKLNEKALGAAIIEGSNMAGERLVTQIVTAYLEALGAEGWQDIATAPKDGDDLLVTDARLQGGFAQVVYWDVSPSSGWHLADGDVVYHPDAFTHWRRDCLQPPSAMLSAAGGRE
jgi:hypothetical protein